MVGAVSQAMQILEILADSANGVGASDLSARFAINKGSVSRLLSTLERDGYVVKNPATGRYELTLKLSALSNRFVARLGFPCGAQSIVSRLAAEVGELVELSAGDGVQLYVIAKDEADRRIAVKSLLGSTLPLHATAGGKAWLSAFPLDVATSIAAKQGLPAFTGRTITDLGTLRSQLREASRREFATQDEESEPDVSAIAVPLRHRVHGTPLGALAVIAPTYRFPDARRLGFLGALRAAAGQIIGIWPDGFSHSLQFGNGRSGSGA